MESVDIAGDGSVSVELGTFGYQTHAIQVMSDLEASHPDTFVAAGKNRDEVETYYLRFTEKPEQSVFDVLAVQPFTTQLSWGLSASAKQLRNGVAAVARALETSPEVSAFTVSPDPFGEGVRAEVSSTRGASIEVLSGVVSDRANDQATALATAGAFPPLPDIALTVGQRRGAPGGIQPQTEVKGGHSVVRCTTGFTATRFGVLGVLTAGHCDTSIYDNDNTVLSFVTSYPPSRAPYPGYVDVKFSSTK